MTAVARLDPLKDAPLVGPRVLSLVGDDSGCSLWRVWQPTRFLRLHGYPCDWTFTRDPNLLTVPFGHYDAVVFCRQTWYRRDRKGAKRMVARWHAQGLKVFFEADDDLFTPFVVQNQLGRIKAEKTRVELERDRSAALWLLRLREAVDGVAVDGVTVSTQYLASTVRRFTAAPVEVVPNAIDAGWFRARQAGMRRTLPPPVVGWVGGNRPDADLEQMAVAWGRLARRDPRVTFAVMGHDPPVVREHVPAGRVVTVPWMHPDDYPKGLVGIDIGCCPLAETPFNRAKTPIKAYEYGLSGAAVVASPTVYRHVIRHHANGLLASTADEWEHALARLLEDEPLRRELANDLEADVLERYALKQHYWRWPAAWHRLMGG